MSRAPQQHRTLRALGLPQPVAVTADADGLPLTVDGRVVEAVREEWRVEEGWWSERPLARRYVETVLADGRLVVLFEDRLRHGRWYAQRS